MVVADDDRATCDHIVGLLRARGLEVVPAYGGQKAVDAVRAHPVDLVILDVGMPGLGGIDACRVVKTITDDRFVPVILLTAHGDLSGRVQGLRTGADDHIAKPLEDAELMARVENMLRVKRAHDDVQVARSKLRHTFLHEQLKTLPDHRYFHESLERAFEAARQHLEPLACCIIAVDDFRKLAKERGPDFATEVLDGVSERLRCTIRKTDVAAQFRTAEFGLLMSNTSPARALTLADRIVTEVAYKPFDVAGESLNLQISIGVGVYPSANVRSHSELLDAASIAVTRARVAGPNRVCVVQQQGYIFRPTLPGAA
ncbi:MAG: diguanylate cyclase [Deltaproteobacteria bacterium]|nr:diguanylate cyclase [Deltaproteobacteria bacterium]